MLTRNGNACLTVERSSHDQATAPAGNDEGERGMSAVIDTNYITGLLKDLEAARQRIAELERKVHDFEITDQVSTNFGLQQEIVQLTARLEAAEKDGARLREELKDAQKSGLAVVNFLHQLITAISADRTCSAGIRSAAAAFKQQIDAALLTQGSAK